MFISPTYGKRTSRELVNDVASFIEDSPDHSYRLIIGTDSHLYKNNGQPRLKVVTAIVVHRQGFGGRYFWESKKISETHTIRDKIYAETLQSLNVAQLFLPKLNQRLNGNGHYELEIHIDVGRVGESRDIIKEVVGIVTGNGYTAKTKPNAYGASKVADKHT
jgi:predicted RNase H-related nuclease YkuK (DUF458 family)